MIDIDPSRPEPQQTGEGPLNLSDFAQRNQMTEDRVWELIEEGELSARFVNDAILILREQDHGMEFADHEGAAMVEPRIEFHEAPLLAISTSEFLPTKPTTPPDIRPVAPGIDALADDHSDLPEDHPDLPTDDYRDLLVFAQDAMNRTMDLSRQLLSAKDELIRMKNERIQQLETEIQRNEQQIRRLRKKVEDLETLCRLTPSL